MTEETKVAPSLDELDAKMLDEKNDPFAREEFKAMFAVALIETAYLPEEELKRKQADYESPAFKAAYPNGVPALHIVLNGLDNFYEPDNQRHLWIPRYNIRDAEKYGNELKRGSQIHVFTEAWVEVFKFRPFGAENQTKAKGLKAIWGQHLSSFVPEGGAKVEFGWDVPRTRLPDDFTFEGTPRRIAARGSGGEAGGAAVGSTEMSEEEAGIAIARALVGLTPADQDEAREKVLAIAGLQAEWYTMCVSKENVIKVAGERGLIDLDADNKIVALTGAEAAV